MLKLGFLVPENSLPRYGFSFRHFYRHAGWLRSISTPNGECCWASKPWDGDFGSQAANWQGWFHWVTCPEQRVRLDVLGGDPSSFDKRLSLSIKGDYFLHGQARKLQSKLVKEKHNAKLKEKQQRNQMPRGGTFFPPFRKSFGNCREKPRKVVHRVRLANRNGLNPAFKNCTLNCRDTVGAKLVGSVVAQKKQKTKKNRTDFFPLSQLN